MFHLKSLQLAHTMRISLEIVVIVSVKIVAIGVQNLHDWLKKDAIASDLCMLSMKYLQLVRNMRFPV